MAPKSARNYPALHKDTFRRPEGVPESVSHPKTSSLAPPSTGTSGRSILKHPQTAPSSAAEGADGANSHVKRPSAAPQSVPSGAAQVQEEAAQRRASNAATSSLGTHGREPVRERAGGSLQRRLSMSLFGSQKPSFEEGDAAEAAAEAETSADGKKDGESGNGSDGEGEAEAEGAPTTASTTSGETEQGAAAPEKHVTLAPEAKDRFSEV